MKHQHSWRLLREVMDSRDVVPGTIMNFTREGYIFFCIKCLKTKEVKDEKD